MALGKEKRSIYEVWSIPFFAGQDENWEDNSWLVEHLRQLANEIEEKNPRIMEIGVRQPCRYGLQLEIKISDV